MASAINTSNNIRIKLFSMWLYNDYAVKIFLCSFRIKELEKMQ